ncbi:MAG: hypothetical protein IJ204_07510 [Paludibacteraceae bacterium]|nr:hypothetical protein [Paludibacteraceae bacterium]
MRKCISLLVLLCGLVAGANACLHRHDTVAELTGFVMDSTAALLPGAEVTLNGTTLTTSWDGRFVFKSVVLKRGSKLKVICRGYEPYSLTLSEPLSAAPLTVTLKAKPHKNIYGEDVAPDGAYGAPYPTGASGRMMLFSSKATARTASASVSPSAYTSDGEVAVEAMEDVAVAETAMEAHMPSAANNAVSAGKLTAGEVNDFAKWYFWPTVMDSTHKQFVQEWAVAPRHRYTAQVVNKNGHPVASRAVSLLDQAGNTLFQAVTDNTGKAELWYQLTGKNLCGKHTDLQIRVDGQVQTAKQWTEGLNVFVLDEACETSDAVDVMFVFDATGSMGDELRYLQAEMKDVIARAKEATGGLNIRTGAVVYRDHQDEYLTRISRLTDDLKTTQAFIDKQSANGGGDFPEAVPEALMAALNSAGWDDNARARIAFLILDAPCHSDSATVALLHDQILNAAAMGVRIVPVVCSGLGESGEFLLRSMALATNGTSFFLTDDSGIGHSHLKPTTDSLKVEHLNDMLVRTIVEFSYMPVCNDENAQTADEQIVSDFMPKPFLAEDIEKDPSIPHGPTTLYLMDVNGKLIHRYEGVPEEASEAQIAAQHIHLSAGIYFVMAFYDGTWHAKKVFVK